MGKETLYSRSRRSPQSSSTAEAAGQAAAVAAEAHGASSSGASPTVPVPPRRGRILVASIARHRAQAAWFVAGVVLAAVLATLLNSHFVPGPRKLTQADIDAAVVHTLAKTTLPSPAAKAAANIRPSVVRVRATGKNEKKDQGTSTGSGVVVVESGLILTSLHVVAGADAIEVTFADGLEADAHLVSAQPENDLAVLQATKLPDDLIPATLRSTGDLTPGDLVVAVGFPFGIGPSVTSGVVSGLRREYQSPEGKALLTNLIQFDAAANPGSSGGPLVTADGEVVGIVTAILNPSEQRVFIGIGFAVPIENAASGLGLPPF